MNERTITYASEEERKTHAALRSFANYQSIERDLPLALTQAMVHTAILAWAAKDAIRHCTPPTEDPERMKKDMLETAGLAYATAWQHLAIAMNLPAERVLRAAGEILVAVDRME